MEPYVTLEGEAARQFCEIDLEMDPAEWDLNTVNRVEIIGTSDDGKEYCEYWVFDCQNKVIAVRRERET